MQACVESDLMDHLNVTLTWILDNNGDTDKLLLDGVALRLNNEALVRAAEKPCLDAVEIFFRHNFAVQSKLFPEESNHHCEDEEIDAILELNRLEVHWESVCF